MTAVCSIMPPLAFLSPSFGEMILIAIIALLLYGSDLPEVARTWGKTYQEFRRHLSGIKNDLNDAIYAESDSPRRLQYYPEFQGTSSSDAKEDVAEECDSPVAREAAEAEKATEAPANPAATVEPAINHDAHGAA